MYNFAEDHEYQNFKMVIIDIIYRNTQK